MHRSRTEGSCETVRWKEKPEQSGQRRGAFEGRTPKGKSDGAAGKSERAIEFKSIGKIRDDETRQKGPDRGDGGTGKKSISN